MTSVKEKVEQYLELHKDDSYSYPLNEESVFKIESAKFWGGIVIMVVNPILVEIKLEI